MTNQHPIIPPLELLDKWDNLPLSTQEIFVIVAQWGADQELKACCELLRQFGFNETLPRLQRVRRPKPPSLKAQALSAIDTAVADYHLSADAANVVRRALEQPDD